MTTGERVNGRTARVCLAGNSLAVDVTPLRRHRDFRLLWSGELVSETGHQMTRVAVLFQVFALTPADTPRTLPSPIPTSTTPADRAWTL